MGTRSTGMGTMGTEMGTGGTGMGTGGTGMGTGVLEWGLGAASCCVWVPLAGCFISSWTLTRQPRRSYPR